MGSAEDPATLINQFIATAAGDGDASVYSAELAELVWKKSISLLEFIQALGPTLTSESTVSRNHSIHCLASTLSHMVDKNCLNKQDVSVLLQFLLAKLDDEKLTLHTLSALTSLVKFKSFNVRVNDNLKKLLEALSNEYEPRKHLAKVRFESFHLLDTLFDKHSEEISPVQDDADLFTSTFIHVASGEKDPRNLLLSFRLNRLINESFSFDSRTDNIKHDRLLTELFDICFCYFPISFTPPPNDPYKISASDLKISLRETIASQSQFAQDTFPSLFEKLTSTNPAVRNDVLQCLYCCIKNYTVNTIEEYWLSIWDALKFEILHNDVQVFKPEVDFFVSSDMDKLDDQDESKTLFLTMKVLNHMSLRLEKTDSFETYVSAILSELRPHFASLGEKTARQSILLLCGMSCSSVNFFNRVVDTVFSFDVWGKFIRSDALVSANEGASDSEIDLSLAVSSKRDLVDFLGFIFTASSLVKEENKLVEFKDHILIFMRQLLQTSSTLEKTLKCKIIQQLTKLVLLPDFLSREDVSLVLIWLGQNMLDTVDHTDSAEWDTDILLEKIVNSVVEILTRSPDNIIQSNVKSVIDTFLPILLERVPSKGILRFINKLCVNYQFLEVLSIRYLNKLTYENYDSDAFGDIIDSIINCFDQTQEIHPFLTNSWYNIFFPRFIKVVLSKEGDNPIILELSGQLIGQLVRFIDQHKHQQILNDYLPVFVENKALNGIQIKNILKCPTPQVTLLKHVISKIDKHVQLSDDQTLTFIIDILELLKNVESDIVRLSYLQVLALLVNKFVISSEGFLFNKLDEIFNNTECDKSLFETAVWILKGLIVRSDPAGFSFVELIISKIEESNNLEYCQIFSRSFIILMSDLEIFSNKGSKTKIISGVVNLNVRPLYKQRLFELVLESTISNFNTSENEKKKEIYLTILAILIKNASAKILRPQLKTVLPLALQGLSLPNSNVLEASLETFKAIIEESPDLIQENVSSLLSKLVHLSTKKIIVDRALVNHEDVRLLSLDCILAIFNKLDSTQLNRYKVATRNQLADGLDDKKRSVRKKTTDVRQVLYELGQ